MMAAYTRSPQTVPDDTPGGSTVRQGVADQNNVAIDDLYVAINAHSNNEDGRSHATIDEELDIIYPLVGSLQAAVESAEESAATSTEQAEIATTQARLAIDAAEKVSLGRIYYGG